MKEIRALKAIACIAQSVERQPFKLVVVGSSPTVGVFVSFGRWTFKFSVLGDRPSYCQSCPCGLMDKASPS